MSGAAFDGIASSTAQVYMRWLQQFSKFCAQVGIAFGQATGAEVAIFLQHLADRGLGASSLSQASSAISWAAQVAGSPDPAREKLVADIIASVRRRGDEVARAEPATKEHLLFLYAWAEKKATFVAARTYVLSLSMLYCCARYSDIAFLHWKDVEIEQDCINITMQKTKTDQCRREGNMAFMPTANDPRLCPVRAINCWRKWPQVGKAADDAIFPTARDTKNPTPYSTYSDNLRDAQLTSTLKKLQPHSWRSAYATFAAAAGLDAAAIAAAGRWRQTSSTETYIRRSKEMRLEVTKRALDF
ncbi:MAG: tyrosine-type recombinase/integrase [Chloroflexi bacterium]|nr:tyrosine-type recombinase/integrase [Chloroflexota bacterium]